MDEKSLPCSDTPNDESIAEDICGPFVAEDKSEVLETERNAREDLLKSFQINNSDTPAYPRYITYEERLKSFEGWPNKSLKLAPDVLSSAGFFYTKYADRTICFHCGGNLQSWDEYDEPWVEHAHWYPSCNYVLSVRGKKFIDDARVMKHEDLARTQDELKTAIETIKEIMPRKVSADLNTVDSKDYLKESSKSTEMNGNLKIRCLICLGEERNTVILPCYHIIACINCSKKLEKCCICRESITYRQRVYIS